jgi:hypothetical protein
MSNNLELINDDDNNFKIIYPELIKKINKRMLKEVEPKLEEITTITKIIINFIKEKKRKIYGGFALNKLLAAKDKSMSFYTEDDTPDIDFYSPSPLEDLKELCDIIYEKKFSPVEGKEAQHKETYSIYVNYKLYCDITYMPSNIYHQMRFIQLDGFMFAHPWFIMIDYFRMFTDPMVSYWRLEKHFERYRKLEKLYPLPKILKPLKLEDSYNQDVKISMNLLFEEVSSYTTTLFTGFYAYNYYLYASEFKNSNNNYNFINIPFYEVYSTNYTDDGLKIIDFIKKSFPKNIVDKIGYEECYPFFQLYGYNTEFYYLDGNEKIPLLYLYSNNKRCIPFKNVEQINFHNKKIEINKNKQINIGSFDFNILHILIILVKIRIDNVNEWNDILYTLINGFVLFRNYYLKKNKITIYDNSIFQSFNIECIGEIILPNRENRLIGEVRRKLGKPVKYIYNPNKNKNVGNYTFLNSSGNEIKNKKHFRLVEAFKNTNLLEDFEKEEVFNDNNSESD